MILGQRLSQWAYKGPFLEEDIALSNISLDMFGRANLFLKYAATLKGNGTTADDLAFKRNEREYCNHILCEQPNGNFADTMVRQFFLDAFYKVRDEIQSWLNPENLSLKKTIQKIREGSYHRDHQSIMQGDSIAVSGNKRRTIPGKVYDPISFVYFLRNQDLSLGTSYKFFSYDQKKIRDVIVNITAEEIVRVSAGKFNCIKIEPVSGDGKPLLKNNGQMRVWLSNDSLRLPVKIEQKTNIGTIVMKLQGIKHSSY